MLCTPSHGAPLSKGALYGQTACASFGYLFPDQPGVSYDKTTVARLEKLHQAMLDADDPTGNHSTLPPVMTYFGQFIDHDITLQESTDPGFLAITGDEVEPRPRDAVVADVSNLRSARLDLDSLYGDTSHPDPVLAKLSGFLRYPHDTAKMWIARFSTPVFQGNTLPGVKFPPGGEGDLLRLDRLMKTLGAETEPRITEAELKSIQGMAKDVFFRPDGSVNMHRAIIGDSRNDENLFIAQLHLAFLRFHNALVQNYPHGRRPGDQAVVFDWARRQTRLHYQWFVLNIYLKELCDPKVYQWIREHRSPLYAHFRQACGDHPDGGFPMPLEFSVAAFRFGHSMVRNTYDWNEFFGRGPQSLQDRATFRQMFEFTGGGLPRPMPLPAPTGSSPHLPSNWGAEWSRLVSPVCSFADRSTRKIDTVIAEPLTDMRNEDQGNATPEQNAINRNLIARNLRRGSRMDIPTGQGCIEGIEKAIGVKVPQLSKKDLTSGSTGKALKDNGFADETPLWFYVLKEAEMVHDGNRLGPLGTHLVAGTLVGLLAADDQSVLHTPGSEDGLWHPRDGETPKDVVIDSFASMMTFAGLM